MMDNQRSVQQLEERVDLLERRVKRIAAERNKARADFARLAAAAQPFAGQTAESLGRWLDATSPATVYRLSRSLAGAVNGDASHNLVSRILLLSETLAKVIKYAQPEAPPAIELRRYADRILADLDILLAESE